jgi:SAM-dependent methyltransferase
VNAPTELVAVERCDLCGGRTFREILRSPDIAELCAPGVHRLVGCSGCGLHFLDPRPTPETIGGVYHPEYEFFGDVSAKTAARWQHLAGRREGGARLRPFARAWVRLRQEMAFHYTPRLRGGGHALDVGCGSGAFLDVLKDVGWRTAGIEPAETALERARAKGHDVRPGGAEALPFDAQTFDVVCLSHVLEHTHSPRRALQEVWRVLRPGGELVLAVPNYGGAQRRLFGRFWSGLDLPRHLYQFDRPTLGRYLAETGFAVEKMWTRTGATSLAKSARLIANGLFGRKWRRDPAWAIALMEVPVLLSTLMGNLGLGRDVRVLALRT